MQRRWPLACALTSAACAAFILIATCVSAKEKVVPWSYGKLPLNYTADLLQCQSLTLSWSNSYSDVWEFPDEESYERCNFTSALPLIPGGPSPSSNEWTLSGPQTLSVTKRWFGSPFHTDCAQGNIRMALKIRPLFVQKFAASECLGATLDISRREESIKECRKRCKRRRGCLAIEYGNATQRCKLFSTVPSFTGSNAEVQCEVAAASCDGLDDSSMVDDVNNDVEDTEEPSEANVPTDVDNDVDVTEDSNEPKEPIAPAILEYKPTPELVGDLAGFAYVEGYGISRTTGGDGAPIVVVNNRDDLISSIKSREPLTILVDGMIDMFDPECPCKTDFAVRSDKTILGIGERSGLKRGGLKISGVKFEKPPDYDPTQACICPERRQVQEEETTDEEIRYPANITKLPDDAIQAGNVIIRNLVFEDCPKDCIGAQHFAHHIWIDHCEFVSPGDGAFDIKTGSDLITVSWNRVRKADKTMLCGHNDDNAPQDQNRLRTTYHHNYFEETRQRHPRVRIAEPVHVYNNYYQKNGAYGIGSSIDAGVVIEGNYFEDVDKPILTVVDDEDVPGRIVERMNMYTRSGLPPPSDGFVEEPGLYYIYEMHEAYEVPAYVGTWSGTGKVY